MLFSILMKGKRKVAGEENAVVLILALSQSLLEFTISPPLYLKLSEPRKGSPKNREASKSSIRPLSNE